MGFTRRRIEFCNWNGISERSVGALNTLVNVPIILATSYQPRKVECGDAAPRIDEQRWIAVGVVGVYSLPEVHRRAPAEVVAGVVAESCVNVEFVTHRKTRGGEEKPMAVR